MCLILKIHELQVASTIDELEEAKRHIEEALYDEYEKRKNILNYNIRENRDHDVC